MFRKRIQIKAKIKNKSTNYKMTVERKLVINVWALLKQLLNNEMLNEITYHSLDCSISQF